EQFLALLAPIELHARITFRGVKCRDQREDAIAETVALAWKWHLRLAARGQDARRFPAVFAALAARAVRSGRRACGDQKATDALSPRAQRRHAFKVQSLPASTFHEHLYTAPHAQQRQDAFEQRLRDHTLSPVPGQAAFRVDFAVWLRTL